MGTDAISNRNNVEPHSFEAIFEAGETALTAGDHPRAHELWRKAATIDPYQEKVWIALLKVLDSEEDRKVCIENILAINPTNADYQPQLKQKRPDAKPAPKTPRLMTSSKSALFLRYMMQGIFLGIIGVLLGVCMSILVYGFR